VAKIFYNEAGASRRIAVIVERQEKNAKKATTVSRGGP